MFLTMLATGLIKFPVGRATRIEGGGDGEVLEKLAEMYERGEVSEAEKRAMIEMVGSGEGKAVRRTLIAMQGGEEEEVSASSKVSKLRDTLILEVQYRRRYF